jgi:hypothetical protein
MTRAKWFGVVAAGLGLALFVVLFSPLASSDPDGLERVAEDREFIDEAKDPSYEILPDYTIPGVKNESVSTILSGIAGVLIVAGIGFGAAYVLKATSKSSNGDPSA